MDSLLWRSGMSLKVWVVFLVTETSLCLSPGPAVLLVVSQGLSRGALASVRSSVGILTGNAIYFLISATGIAALLVSSGRAFVALTVVGAAYTLWLGVQTLLGHSAGIALVSADSETLPRRKMFLNGFILQVSKPGLLVYFGAVLPLFISEHGSVAGQVAVLAITSISVEFMVLCTYGVLAGRMSRFATRPGFTTIVNRIAGTMLMIASLGLLVRRAG
jgi:threonine/homoserine/homoserine lactone efflux protein